MYAGKTSNTQKKRLKGWEPEFKGTGGEAYTTSSPPPYLSLGPTHIYRNKITITLPELQNFKLQLYFIRLLVTIDWPAK